MRRMTGLMLILSSLLFWVLPTPATAEEGEKWKGESIYYITVDRFMNGKTANDKNLETGKENGYHGGDLQGVTEKLDYIKDLGFTTIWLSPLMSSSDFEGYEVKDYKKVDEHLGTMKEVRTLTEEAHNRDMKVIMDMPLMGIDEDHPWVEKGFTERSGNGEVKVKETGGDVQKEISSILSYWKEEAGLDGFGFPEVEEASPDFWQKTLSDVTDMVLIGKGEDSSYSKAGFDIWYDESYQEAISESFSGTGNIELPAPAKEGTTASAVDFHDTRRFTTLSQEAGFNPVTRWKLALTQLYTDHDVAVVQYGTAIPMGEKPGIGNLPMMNFGGTDEEVTRRINKLNAMQNEFPSFAKGEVQKVYNEGGMEVFKIDGEKTMLVAVNNSEETKSGIVTSLGDNKQLRGLMHDGFLRQSDDGKYRVVLERETADVFVVEDSAGINWLFVGFVVSVMAIFVIFVIMTMVKNRKQKINGH
ncbi:hypothetical protein AAV35_009325 [Salimicrobium jeotgali]|uniref:Alpha-amylase family protein n=1 Tax=Salimicrobium jeotgali TaxID=1230341 RepID=K2GMQ1_9BACI|nr:alpha-amylase family glycosyl hydrolase [Salimicrobium jeotgali]AKG04982.1 hypothetical protein AAV35_009325 [Salimicrobium jeotgali]EKE31664.1 alpha-amylase family protein [Salimicrobium jeotgali]MBM7696486.1 glycosidase [Salimicrobium jeotgali]